jgi:uncharacterized protein YbjQ (UPF0145 family)
VNAPAIDYAMVTTALTVPGYRIVRTGGLVRGITVRSAHLGEQIVAGFRSLGGGRINEYIKMCEAARTEALASMVWHAQEMGANAIICVRYDATELAQNMTEVLAYGTAAWVEPES